MMIRRLSVLAYVLAFCFVTGSPAAQRVTALPLESNVRPNAPCNRVGSNSFLANAVENIASGAQASVLAGTSNTVCDSDASVGSGSNNRIFTADGSGAYSFIEAGSSNVVSGSSSFIGSGTNNSTSASPNSAIVAGMDNFIASSPNAIIGGGTSNTITGARDAVIWAGSQNSVSAIYGAVGGGYQNKVYPMKPGGAAYGFIGGGYENTATGEAAVVTGGEGNVASGDYSVIPGGYHNLAAGTLSFAAGYGAQAIAPGSFVWADYSVGARHLTDSTPNSFLVRASGGITFWSNPDETTGVVLAPGSGSWASASDRAIKSSIANVSDLAVAKELKTMSVSSWRYISQPGVRHVGPMAQDFYAKFGLGDDDKHITTIDEEGVALSAIKAIDASQVAVGRNNSRMKAVLANYDAEDKALRERALQLIAYARSLKNSVFAASCSGSGSNAFLANTHGNIASAPQDSIGGGSGNVVCDKDGTVATGSDNSIGSGSGDASRSFIGGGTENRILSSDSFIGSGSSNVIEATSEDSSIIAGSANVINPESLNSPAADFVGGGESNRITSSGGYEPSTTVLGGSSNAITQGSGTLGSQNLVIGGFDNSIQSTGSGPSGLSVVAAGYENHATPGLIATIGGGAGNVAAGGFSTIPGGYHNFASSNSFAAGFGSYDRFGGSFLWSDFSHGASHLATTTFNQFLVRASGGVNLYSNSSANVGVSLAPGSGSWSSASDRQLKQNFRSIDPFDVLRKLRRLPIYTWTYKSALNARHMGPMAEDFYGAYGLGADDRHITSIDEDGVAFLALQALNWKSAQLLAEERFLSGRVAAVRTDLARLSRSIQQLSFVTAAACSEAGSSSFVANDQGNTAAGSESSVIGGENNMVCDDSSVIFAGLSNSVSSGSDQAKSSAVSAGQLNVVKTESSTIGGGTGNGVSGSVSAIGGGKANDIVGGNSSIIGGGFSNIIRGTTGSGIGGGVANQLTAFRKTTKETNASNYTFIGGGARNSVSPLRASDGMYATIVGGDGNEVEGQGATIGGGEGNTRSGFLATVPGGYLNSSAGALSFASGSMAYSNSAGSFVWNDSAGSSLTATVPNQMLVHASGGASFFSNTAASSGVSLSPGSGVWESSSDRDSKTDFLPIEGSAVLSSVSALRIASWSYKSEGRVRHLGPTSQEFFEKFSIGEDNRHISAVDEDGIVLAAIRAAILRENAIANANQLELARANDLGSFVGARRAILMKRSSILWELRGVGARSK